MISSLDNARVKFLSSLKQAKNRKLNKMYIVEGPHLVSEARYADVLVEAFSLNEKDGYETVSYDVMKKICNTDSVVSEIALCKMKDDYTLGKRLVLLDSIQDPGNMGTILRTAKAFSFDTIVIGNGCCDIYNDKVIRASQGAIFKLSFINANLVEFIKNTNYHIYGTDVRCGISVEDVNECDNFGFVLGNEGNGISDEVKNVIDKNIYIPINNMESLNVSIASGIIMYEFSKKFK